MPIRTIKVYCCEICEVESISTDAEGWVWAGRDAENDHMTHPKIIGSDGTSSAYHRWPPFKGMFCSITCFIVAMKKVLEEKGAREFPA